MAKLGGKLERAMSASMPHRDDFDDHAFEDPSLEWRRLIAEAWGSFLLTLVAVGAAAARSITGETPTGALAVAPGLTVMVVIYSVGAVSGAHINPAVSFAFAVRRNFPWRRVPGYWIAQFGGSLLAMIFLWGVFGSLGDVGATTPHRGVAPLQALIIETVLATALVTTILATASGARNIGANVGIAVGGYIALAGLWAEPLIGASMNPARSLAPDLIRGDLTTSWIYLIGPLLGAAIGVALESIIKGPPTRAGDKSAQGQDSEN